MSIKKDCTTAKGDRTITVNPLLEEFEETVKSNWIAMKEFTTESSVQYKQKEHLELSKKIVIMTDFTEER